MLILVSAILFAIGISLLALSAALLAIKILLWVVMVVFRALYLLTAWLISDKSPEAVEAPGHENGQVEAAFTLTQNKDGIWVLK
jgi:hypothetical protein